MAVLSNGSLRVVLVALLLSTAADAQDAGSTLQGTIADEQGAVLQGASVTVTNVETGWTRTIRTDDRGWYRATALPPGGYVLRVVSGGFRSETREGLALTVGQEATINVSMKIAAVADSIIVTATTPLVNTADHTIGTTVTRTQLDGLPLAARDFASLAQTGPGIFSSPDLARPTGAGSLTSGAQLSRNNSILIDGVSNDQITNATTRGGFSLETVREFVVLANQFSAEYGLASGAVVSVVTRSGTNRLQARGFLFHRDDALDAQDPFSKAQGSGRAPFSSHRFGGFAGGPVRRDRLHYFTSYERVRQSQTSVVTSPIVPVTEREFPRDWRQHLYFLKADYRLNDDHTFWVRYRIDDASALGNGIGGIDTRERGFDTIGRASDVALNHTAVLSARALHEFRFQFGRQRADNVPYMPLGTPSIARRSGNFGKPTTMPFGIDEPRYQFVENVSLSRGAHDLKIGADISVIRMTGYRYLNVDGTFRFDTDLPFDANDPRTYPSQFTQNIGSPFTQRDNELYAFFFQDSWRAGRHVTLNLGVRYDRETAYKKAVGVEDDTNNLVPRLGFVWDVGGTGRTAVRGGYGWYVDQAFLNITGNIQQARQFTSVTIVNPGYPDPYARGSVRPEQPSTEIASPDIQTPATRQVSLGVQRELGPGLAVSVDVVHARGYHLYSAPDINSPDPITRIRPNPHFLRITQHETTGNSWYKALLVGLEKRSGAGPTFGVAYTLARQVRDVEDFLFRGQDQLNREAEKALADNHRTHQFAANTTWLLPGGFLFGAVLQARSGLPWTMTTNIDNNRDGIFTNDRPDLVVASGNPRDRTTYFGEFTDRVGTLGRNTAIGPSSMQLDVRVAKRVKLRQGRIELFIDAFNLTNRANLGKPEGRLSSVPFGRSIGLAGPPRQIEIGVRADF